MSLSYSALIGIRFHFLHPDWRQVAVFGSLAIVSSFLNWRRRRR